MTCDGDWLGGSSSPDGLAADLDLAGRRGVEVVIDMRSERARASTPLSELPLRRGSRWSRSIR